MPYLSELPYTFLVWICVSLGLVFGSFLNVVIYRLPRGENLAHPGSACPACGEPIRGYNNIPVLSWLLLRGKARCCGVKISARYPAVEALGGLTAWAILERIVLDLPLETIWWQALLVFLLHLALALGMIAAAFIDIEHMIVPDEITIGGALLGLVSTMVRPDFTWSDCLIGAVVGFLIVWLPFDVGYRLLRGQVGMAQGDAKLVMLAGAWFGWPGALFALLAGAIQGTLVAIVLFLTQGRIEDPEFAERTRKELEEAIEQAEDEEEREALELELAEDPMAHAAEGGLGGQRMAFGPLLVVATLEFQLFGGWMINTWLLGAL